MAVGAYTMAFSTSSRGSRSGSRCRLDPRQRWCSACSSACPRCGCARITSRSRRWRRRRSCGRARNLKDVTGGSEGLSCSDTGFRCFDDSWRDVSEGIEGFLQDLGWSDPETLFPLLLVVWGFVIVLTILLKRTTNTPWGRVLRAIREDEDAARALGKNPLAYKLQSLAIAAGIAAIAGWFLAFNLASIAPTEFLPIVTFYAYAILILGGLASYWGLIAGAAVLWTLLEATRFIELPDRRRPGGRAPLRDRRPG